MPVRHAPAHGSDISGKHFAGGEFIPGQGDDSPADDLKSRIAKAWGSVQSEQVSGELSQPDGSRNSVDSELYQHVPLLKKLGARYGYNGQDLEDFVGDVILQALSKKDQFDANKGKLTTWLGYVAQSVASNDRKSRSAIKRGGGVIPSSLSSSEVDFDPEDYRGEKDRKGPQIDDIEPFLNKLRPNHQSAIRGILAGKSQQELATEQGITRQAVSINYQRGVDRIRAMILDEIAKRTGKKQMLSAIEDAEVEQFSMQSPENQNRPDQRKPAGSVPEGKVRMVQAPKGGAVSNVNGIKYAGGRWMPVHGLHAGKVKPPPRPKPEVPQGPPPVSSLIGRQPAARQMSAEDIESEKKAKEQQRRWDAVRSGPLGKLLRLGNSPGYAGYDVKKMMLPYLASMKPEQVQAIGNSIRSLWLDHDSANAPAGMGPDEARKLAESDFHRSADDTAGMLIPQKLQKSHPGISHVVEGLRSFVKRGYGGGSSVIDIDHAEKLNSAIASSHHRAAGLPEKQHATPTLATPAGQGLLFSGTNEIQKGLFGSNFEAAKPEKLPEAGIPSAPEPIKPVKPKPGQMSLFAAAGSCSFIDRFSAIWGSMNHGPDCIDIEQFAAKRRSEQPGQMSLFDSPDSQGSAPDDLGGSKDTKPLTGNAGEISSFLKNKKSLPENVLVQHPSGKWGFAGKVHHSLHWEKDGNPVSDEDLKAIQDAASFGEAFGDSEAKKRGVQKRTFNTREEAKSALDRFTDAGQQQPGKVKMPWEMTYRELHNAVRPGTHDELHQARPILRALYPEHDDRITATAGDDPWGIHRAIHRGDELPRVPTVDLSTRHRKAIQEAIAAGHSVPPLVLSEYPDLLPVDSQPSESVSSPAVGSSAVDPSIAMKAKGKKVSSYIGNQYEFQLPGGERKSIVVDRSHGMAEARKALHEHLSKTIGQGRDSVLPSVQEGDSVVNSTETIGQPSRADSINPAGLAPHLAEIAKEAGRQNVNIWGHLKAKAPDYKMTPEERREYADIATAHRPPDPTSKPPSLQRARAMARQLEISYGKSATAAPKSSLAEMGRKARAEKSLHGGERFVKTTDGQIHSLAGHVESLLASGYKPHAIEKPDTAAVSRAQKKLDAMRKTGWGIPANENHPDAIEAAKMKAVIANPPKVQEYRMMHPDGDRWTVITKAQFDHAKSKQQADPAPDHQQLADELFGSSKPPTANEAEDAENMRLARHLLSGRGAVLPKTPAVVQSQPEKQDVKNNLWEITRSEFEQRFRPIVKLQNKSQERTFQKNIDMNRQRIIEQAIASGHTVPAHVLADYPELAGKSATAAEPVVATEHDPLHTAIGKRFGIPPQAVKDVLELHPDELAKRDEYLAPSSPRDQAVGPTLDYPKHALGSAKIGLNAHKAGETGEAYVDYLGDFPTSKIKLSEHEDGMSGSGSVRSYAEWAKSGHQAPPSHVYGHHDNLVTTNRRRLLAAKQAGQPTIRAWHGIENRESGLPLKYKDIHNAAKEMSGSLPSQPVSNSLNRAVPAKPIDSMKPKPTNSEPAAATTSRSIATPKGQGLLFSRTGSVQGGLFGQNFEGATPDKQDAGLPAAPEPIKKHDSLPGQKSLFMAGKTLVERFASALNFRSQLLNECLVERFAARRKEPQPGQMTLNFDGPAKAPAATQVSTPEPPKPAEVAGPAIPKPSPIFKQPSLFDEAKHPRWQKGDHAHHGGEFSPKNNLKSKSHTAIYNGKEVDAEDFKQAAQRVHVNLKSGEHGYVRTPDGKLFEISTDKRMAVPVNAMRSKEQRDISLLEDRLAKSQFEGERATLSKRLAEMKSASNPEQTSDPEQKFDEKQLEDFGLYRKFGEHHQYAFEPGGKFYHSDSKEGAIKQAHANAIKAEKAGTLRTKSQRYDDANESLFKDFDSRYRNVSNEKIEAELGTPVGEHSDREFDGNGGRRSGPAMANQGRREEGDHKLKLGIYLKMRKERQVAGSMPGNKPVEQTAEPNSEGASTSPVSPAMVRHGIDRPKHSIFAGNYSGTKYIPNTANISVKALKGADAIWHHQGDPRQTMFNAAQKDAHEHTLRKSKEILEAQKAGYSLVNHRAGKYGTLYVFEKDGNILTERGAKSLVDGTGTIDLSGHEGMEHRHAAVKHLAAFIDSLPESTRNDFGALVTAINRSPIGKHVKLARENNGYLRLEPKGERSWYLHEPNSGHDSAGNYHRLLPSSLPRFLDHIRAMASTEIPKGEGGWAIHERNAVPEVPTAEVPKTGKVFDQGSQLKPEDIKTTKDLDDYRSHPKNHLPDGSIESRYGTLKKLFGEDRADKVMRELEVQSWTAPGNKNPDSKAAGLLEPEAEQIYNPEKRDKGTLSSVSNSSPVSEPVTPELSSLIVGGSKFDPERHGGHEALFKVADDIDSGKLDVDQFKSAHALYHENKEAFIADLGKRMNADQMKKLATRFGSYHAKTEKKEKNAQFIYDRLMSHAFDVGKGISTQYTMDQIRDPNEKGRRLAAHVSNQTAESLAAHVEAQKGKAEERAKRETEADESLVNPKTLDDFSRLANKLGGFSKMTPEQRVTHDDLMARARREQTAKERATVKAVSGTAGDPGRFTTGIVEGHHQKHNKPTHTVTVAERMGEDAFREATGKARALGGSYVNARIARAYRATPGFQFFDKSAAEQFEKILKGETVDRSEYVEAQKAETIEHIAAKLTEVGMMKQEAGEEAASAARRENTRRQSDMAAHSRAEANRKAAFGKTLQRIGEHLASGKSVHLNGIRHATHVEALDAALRDGRYERYQRAQKDGTITGSHDNFMQEPSSAEDILAVQYPYPKMWSNELRDMAKEFGDEPGLKNLSRDIGNIGKLAVKFRGSGNRVNFTGGQLLTVDDIAKEIAGVTDSFRKHFDGKSVRVHRTTDRRILSQASGLPEAFTADGGKSFGQSPVAAVVVALKRGQKLDLTETPQEKLVSITNPDSIEALRTASKRLKRHSNRSLNRIGENLAWRLEKHDRLKAADITTGFELRAALREYLPLKMDQEKESPISKAERELKGQKISGFFPTPRGLIDHMLDHADIGPGMSVLEPSAGKGDILDAIMERHADDNLSTHAIEPNFSLRSILGLKGHNVVDHDFMQHAGQYDRVVMNPPFERGQDMEHVKHAFGMLKPGGKLVAVMAGGNSGKRPEFDQWVNEQGGTVDELPPGSFSGSDAFRQTGVNTKMVVISKNGLPERFAAIWSAVIERFDNSAGASQAKPYMPKMMAPPPPAGLNPWPTAEAPNPAQSPAVAAPKAASQSAATHKVSRLQPGQSLHLMADHAGLKSGRSGFYMGRSDNRGHLKISVDGGKVMHLPISKLGIKKRDIQPASEKLKRGSNPAANIHDIHAKDFSEQKHGILVHNRRDNRGYLYHGGMLYRMNDNEFKDGKLAADPKDVRKRIHKDATRIHLSNNGKLTRENQEFYAGQSFSLSNEKPRTIAVRQSSLPSEKPVSKPNAAELPTPLPRQALVSPAKATLPMPANKPATRPAWWSDEALEPKFNAAGKAISTAAKNLVQKTPGALSAIGQKLHEIWKEARPDVYANLKDMADNWREITQGGSSQEQTKSPSLNHGDQMTPDQIKTFPHGHRIGDWMRVIDKKSNFRGWQNVNRLNPELKTDHEIAEMTGWKPVLRAPNHNRPAPEIQNPAPFQQSPVSPVSTPASPTEPQPVNTPPAVNPIQGGASTEALQQMPSARSEDSIAVPHPDSPQNSLPQQNAAEPQQSTEPQSIPHSKGVATSISVPGGKDVSGHYAVIDLKHLNPSHSYSSGRPSPNPNFPAGLQPRDYSPRSENDMKVRDMVRLQKPGYYLSHPDATSGAPVISPNGDVINGNGRAMSLQLAASQGNMGWYRSALEQHLPSVGLDASSLSGKENPVLVRMVPMDSSSNEAREFARSGNVSTTQQDSPTRTGASLGALIDNDVLGGIEIPEDSTLSEVLSKNANHPLTRTIFQNIPSQVRPTYFTPEGHLTDSGKEMVTDMLLTKLLPVETVERMGSQSRSLKNAIEASIPQVMSLRGKVDITPQLNEAIQYLMKNPKDSNPGLVDQTLSQSGIWSDTKQTLSPGSRMLVDFLLNARNASGGYGSRVVRSGLVNLAKRMAERGGMFGDSMEEHEDAADALGVQARDGARFGHYAAYQWADVQRFSLSETKRRKSLKQAIRLAFQRKIAG